MSYILDALRKAEQDRNRGEVPGIEDLQTTKSPEKKPFSQWGWVALAVMNVLLLGFLFWPDVEKSSTEKEVVVAKSPQLAQNKTPGNQQKITSSKSMPVIAAPKVVEPQKPMVIEQESADTPTDIVYPQKAKEAEWTNIDDRPLQPIPPLPEVPASEVPRQKAVAKQTSAKKTSGKVTFLKDPETMQADNTEAASESMQPTAESPPASADGLAIWPQVPSNLFSQLQGSLRMDVHVYAQLPEERFVLINLGKYHEGEEMQEGPYIEEITEHGVILEFSGERFLLPAY